MTTDSTIDLDGWMVRLADGDRSVLPGVFNALWPPVRRMCHALLKNEADAEDGAQQAMLKIMSRASDYDSTRRALPWALCIASWECRSIARKRQRRREFSVADAKNPIEWVPTEESNPERLSQEHELSTAVLAAMGELSETDRNALLGAFWDEAASAVPNTNTKDKTATERKRRQRAIERLRAALRRIYDVA
jgi:RNA polymerase sigma-70 factor (ECF subfamily)